jgi:8-oxo-dGTP pyrophosphatase MutT (NUDIX family)
VQEYVLGFLFSPNKKKVVLIEKKRPAWQAGLYNGVGGHVEARDPTPSHAMYREFYEETGFRFKPERWNLLKVMEFDNGAHELAARVHIFYGVSRNMDRVRTITDEKVGVFRVDDLPPNRIDNIQGFIAECLGKKELKRKIPGDLLLI